MANESERIAKALESLVILVDEIRAQMVMEKQDDVDERKRASFTRPTIQMTETFPLPVSDGARFNGLLSAPGSPGTPVEVCGTFVAKDVY